MSSLHETRYRFGDTVIALTSPEFTESSFLSCFRFHGEEKSDIRMEIVPSDSAEEDASAHTVRDVGTGRILWQRKLLPDGSISVKADPSIISHLNTRTVTEMMELPALMLTRGCMILHASFIEKDGRAILFTAPKRTGKSTQAKLWETEKHAVTVNGDRALIGKRGGVWYAHGLPFCGTSGICRNESCPLQAVVILSQSDVNDVRSADGREIASALLSGCSFRADDDGQMNDFLRVAESLSADVPFIRLSCRPDKEAADILENYLTEHAHD